MKESDTYLEHCQRSLMELFYKYNLWETAVNGFAKSSITDV